jgi:hypothetical protein
VDGLCTSGVQASRYATTVLASYLSTVNRDAARIKICY